MTGGYRPGAFTITGMAESFVQVNVPAVPGKKLKTYRSTDGGGNSVENEAVTLTDGEGNELLGARPAADSVPVVLASDGPALGTMEELADLQLGAEHAVSNVEVELLAENAGRKWAIVQNNGDANIRIGPPGVTSTTGLRVRAGATVMYPVKNAIHAIREGSVDSVAFAQDAL